MCKTPDPSITYWFVLLEFVNVVKIPTVMNFGMDVTVNTATCNGCQTIGLMSWSMQRLPDNRIVETVARQSDGSCKDDTKTILPTAYEPTLEPNGYGRVQSFDLLLDNYCHCIRTCLTITIFFLGECP